MRKVAGVHVAQYCYAAGCESFWKYKRFKCPIVTRRVTSRALREVGKGKAEKVSLQMTAAENLQ